MQNSPQWHRDEEYRQSVIRKALLLGFECQHRPRYTHNGREEGSYEFVLNGETYRSYGSIYSAAYEYLRLLKVPQEVIGDYRG